jgi:hypothetical protein
MPPENQGYMVAAYVVTAVILVGYALLLVRRARRAIEEASRPEGREPTLPA